MWVERHTHSDASDRQPGPSWRNGASLSYRVVMTPLVRPVISEPARGRLWRGRPRAHVMAGLLSAKGGYTGAV